MDIGEIIARAAAGGGRGPQERDPEDRKFKGDLTIEVTALLDSFKVWSRNEELKVGDLVEQKQGVQVYNLPLMGQPAVVAEMIADAKRDEDTGYRDDIRLMIRDPRGSGAIAFVMGDSRHFQKLSTGAGSA